MLKENISMLRSVNGYSQEEVAEKIGVSRQAYAKWEKGETVPDVERCQKLAELYGVTIDSLVNYSDKIGTTTLTPGPKGKHIFGTTKINERGQVVIPKKARELFGINNGDSLVVLGDEAEGIALIKVDIFEKRLNDTWNSIKQGINE
ncbi:MAG: helix-turn-helix domain-containing protein [Lachnospiraceae bacterium]|nr:helix-turn-helix domain-containing protein [Lachnospiraceae bacterium]